MNAEIKSQLIAGSADDKTTCKGLSEPDVSLGKLLQNAETKKQPKQDSLPNSNCQQTMQRGSTKV